MHLCLKSDCVRLGQIGILVSGLSGSIPGKNPLRGELTRKHTTRPCAIGLKLVHMIESNLSSRELTGLWERLHCCRSMRFQISKSASLLQLFWKILRMNEIHRAGSDVGDNYLVSPNAFPPDGCFSLSFEFVCPPSP